MLLLDPADRVLLVRFEDRETNYAWWTTPGGGVRPDESPEEAARREVAEETGLRDFALGPCVWLREFEFLWRGRRYRQRERIFAARVAAFAPSRDSFEQYELDLLPEHRWWRASEIEGSPEVFGPRRLGLLLGDLLAAGFPAQPIEIGT